jgi:energy-coupling factor transporter transmembrane protein EcfT
MKRFNWRLWTGLVLTVVAFLSYYMYFAQFVATRDVPWVPYIMMAIAAFLLVTGWRRAPRKILASIVIVLGFFVIGTFTYLTTIFSRDLPAAANAPAVGRKAPDFALRDTNGRTITLGNLLEGSNGVLLIFYRGYW